MSPEALELIKCEVAIKVLREQKVEIDRSIQAWKARKARVVNEMFPKPHSYK